MPALCGRGRRLTALGAPAYTGRGAKDPGLGPQPRCHQPHCDLGPGASSLLPAPSQLLPCQLQHSQTPLLQVPKPYKLSFKSISHCLQIHFVSVLLLLPSFLFCCTKCVCSSAFPRQKLCLVPAGFAKKHPSGHPSQGNARPEDGALGLFTLRHIITERWIRSYLRSAFSQSSLATQPPRYKYTPETCRDAYAEWRPSEAQGKKPLGGKDIGRSPGGKGVPVSSRQGQIWRPPNKTPWSLRVLRHPIPNAGHLSSLWIANMSQLALPFHLYH